MIETVKFVNQYRNEEMLETKYDAGIVTKNGDQFCVGYETNGAGKTFSIGQPVYDKDFNLMGYLGIGFWEHLDYAGDMRIPVEMWTICLPTEHCIEGKHVYTYWQMMEAKKENKDAAQD